MHIRSRLVVVLAFATAQRCRIGMSDNSQKCTPTRGTTGWPHPRSVCKPLRPASSPPSSLGRVSTAERVLAIVAADDFENVNLAHDAAHATKLQGCCRCLCGVLNLRRADIVEIRMATVLPLQQVPRLSALTSPHGAGRTSPRSRTPGARSLRVCYLMAV